MTTTRVTRGFGVLEECLARQRSRMANRLIPPDRRAGRLLDIGCGTFPFFLLHTHFAEKYGLDQVTLDETKQSFLSQPIWLVQHDIARERALPFDSAYFDVVTMLAVVEHIDQARLVGLFMEIHRVLKPGGLCILTVPPFWTDGLLRGLAAVGLISRVELEEHQHLYSHAALSRLLQAAHFSAERLRFGYFELGMNLWATAAK